jgi:hypothetical protein
MWSGCEGGWARSVGQEKDGPEWVRMTACGVSIQVMIHPLSRVFLSRM